jgi:hypothetical protein
MIVLRRKIAVSIFDSRCDSSRPPAPAVTASDTELFSGASSGLALPHESCCRASRNGSA